MGQGLLLIPLVRVSLINVGSGFYQNLNFSFLGQLFQYCLLGLKAYRLKFASFSIRAQVLKSVFSPFIFCFLLSSYLVPFVFFISRSYFVTCTRLKLCTKLPKGKKKKKEKKKKKKRLYKRNIKQKKKKICSFNSLRPKYYFLLSPSFDLVFLSYFLAIGISLNTTSWISWSSLLV